MNHKEIKSLLARLSYKDDWRFNCAAIPLLENYTETPWATAVCVFVVEGEAGLDYYGKTKIEMTRLIPHIVDERDTLKMIWRIILDIETWLAGKTFKLTDTDDFNIYTLPFEQKS